MPARATGATSASHGNGSKRRYAVPAKRGRDLFTALPRKVQRAVVARLAQEDWARLLAASMQLREVCGEHVTAVTLRQPPVVDVPILCGDKEGARRLELLLELQLAAILRLLSGLRQVTLVGPHLVPAFAQAVVAGTCSKRIDTIVVTWDFRRRNLPAQLALYGAAECYACLPDALRTPYLPWLRHLDLAFVDRATTASLSDWLPTVVEQRMRELACPPLARFPPGAWRLGPEAVSRLLSICLPTLEHLEVPGAALPLVAALLIQLAMSRQRYNGMREWKLPLLVLRLEGSSHRGGGLLRHERDRDALATIMALLATGRAPFLERLTLVNVRVSQGLSKAIAGGHLRHLEELGIHGDALDDQGLQLLAAAVQQQPLLLLGKLTFGSLAHVTPAGFAPLAAALAAGGMPLLKHLSLRHSRLGKEGLLALAGRGMYVPRAGEGDGGIIISRRRRPLEQLRHLDLHDCGLERQGLAALATALGRHRALPHLTSLHLGAEPGNGGNARGDPWADCLAAVLMGSGGDGQGMPRLQRLDLKYSPLGEGALVGLAEAIRRGRLPDLRHLAYAGSLTPLNACHFVEALAARGGGCRLVCIDLDSHYPTADSPFRARDEAVLGVWLQRLRDCRGFCPWLRTLRLGRAYAAELDVIVMVRRAVQAQWEK